MISVIIPTIDGRELWLKRCERSYRQWTEDCELIIVRNQPTCNRAWNVGIEESKGDFIHLSADDIEATEKWWKVGIEWVESGVIPAPRIINPDGSLQSCGDGDWEQETGSRTNMTRVPFFSREQMEKAGIYPIIDSHYFGDAWVTHRAAMVGIPTLVVREMQFIHSFSNVGRLDGQFEADLEVFRKAQRRDGSRATF